MQAFVTAKTCSEYETLLKENQCLIIRNPSLGENCQKSIQQDPNDDGKAFKSPIDVIGFVVKSFPFEPKEESKHGNDEKKITFMLEDLQHAQIFVTLWDGYAHQILEFQRINQEEKNVAVAVQF
ncbi:putative nucleic acid-binding protein [Helianthus annuus]|nr:putative nucleic acid-binding protein [Helianthus annuus]KAJ0540760.1 putative nucleic acid-binding protein [Helianthus annuus]KAJ0705867.1 putative nucleic acid-binding protein [Helianthus annuus]KAJ0886217.1 putative nucleic acid-binding protein [Helianthus annuus]